LKSKQSFEERDKRIVLAILEKNVKDLNNTGIETTNQAPNPLFNNRISIYNKASQNV
jgi:hypothetical protein